MSLDQSSYSAPAFFHFSGDSIPTPSAQSFSAFANSVPDEERDKMLKYYQKTGSQVLNYLHSSSVGGCYAGTWYNIWYGDCLSFLFDWSYWAWITFDGLIAVGCIAVLIYIFYLSHRKKSEKAHHVHKLHKKKLEWKNRRSIHSKKHRKVHYLNHDQIKGEEEKPTAPPVPDVKVEKPVDSDDDVYEPLNNYSDDYDDGGGDSYDN